MNRNLALLLSGQLVSQIGDKFHMLAVAFLVLKTTGSPAKMGILLFCSIFPSVGLGFVAGAFLDRYSRKKVIVAADSIRGLIVAGLGILFFTGALSFPLLLTAQLLLSACTAFFDPAVPAIIPQIVGKEGLSRANSQTQFISGIATILGPALGGLAVAWAGYLPVFFINAGSYLFSAVFESFIRLPERGAPAAVRGELADDIVKGWRYVWRRKHLTVILVTVGVIHFFVGSIEVVIPVLATQLAGGGAENIGFIQTFFGLGTVAAAFFLSIKTIDGRETRCLFGSIFLIGIWLLILSAVYLSGIRTVSPFLALFLAIGASIIFAGTSFRSILQKEVDEYMMGRVFGFAASVGNISIPLAILVFGILLESVSLGAVLALSGFVLLPLGIVYFRKFTTAADHGSPAGRLT